MTQIIDNLNTLRAAIRNLLTQHNSQVERYRANRLRRRQARKLIKNRKLPTFYYRKSRTFKKKATPIH